MVATQFDTLSDAVVVAGRAASIHRARGEQDVAVTTLQDLAADSVLGRHIPCVTVAGRRVVEVVVGPTIEPGALAAEVAALVGDEWLVTVLVPSSRMGVAHRALRRSGCTLQQWWREGAVIGFGAPEIP